MGWPSGSTSPKVAICHHIVLWVSPGDCFLSQNLPSAKSSGQRNGFPKTGFTSCFILAALFSSLMAARPVPAPVTLQHQSDHMDSAVPTPSCPSASQPAPHGIRAALCPGLLSVVPAQIQPWQCSSCPGVPDMKCHCVTRGSQ